MTSKADSLVMALDETAYSRNGSAEHSKAYSALVCYIEELERKAAAYDANLTLLRATAPSEREIERDEWEKRSGQ